MRKRGPLLPRRYATLPIEERIKLHNSQPIQDWWRKNVKFSSENKTLTLKEISSASGKADSEIRHAFRKGVLKGNVGFAESKRPERFLPYADAKKLLESRGFKGTLKERDYSLAEVASLARLSPNTIKFHLKSGNFENHTRPTKKGKHTWIAKAKDAVPFVEQKRRVLTTGDARAIINERLSDLGVNYTIQQFENLVDEQLRQKSHGGKHRRFDFLQIMKLAVKIREAKTNYVSLNEVFGANMHEYRQVLKLINQRKISPIILLGRKYVPKALVERVKQERPLLSATKAAKWLRTQGVRRSSVGLRRLAKKRELRATTSLSGDICFSKNALDDYFLAPIRQKTVLAEELGLQKGTRPYSDILGKNPSEARKLFVLLKSKGIHQPKSSITSIKLKNVEELLEQKRTKKLDGKTKVRTTKDLLDSVNIHPGNIYYPSLLKLTPERTQASINAIRSLGINDMSHLAHFFMDSPGSLTKEKRKQVLNRQRRVNAESQVRGLLVQGMLTPEIMKKLGVPKSFVKRRIATANLSPAEKNERIKALLLRGFPKGRVAFWAEADLKNVEEIALRIKQESAYSPRLSGGNPAEKTKTPREMVAESLSKNTFAGASGIRFAAPTKLRSDWAEQKALQITKQLQQLSATTGLNQSELIIARELNKDETTRLEEERRKLIAYMRGRLPEAEVAEVFKGYRERTHANN